MLHLSTLAFVKPGIHLDKGRFSEGLSITKGLLGAQIAVISLLLAVGWQGAGHKNQDQESLSPVNEFTVLATVHASLLEELDLSAVGTVSQGLCCEAIGQILQVTKRNEAPDIGQYVLLDVDQGLGKESLCIDQPCVLLLRSHLPVNDLEAVKTGPRVLKCVVRLSLRHVRRWPVIELNRLDEVMQVGVLEDDRVEVHLVFVDASSDLLDGVLAGLVLLLHGDHDPVVQNIEHFEGLARYLMQY